LLQTRPSKVFILSTLSTCDWALIPLISIKHLGFPHGIKMSWLEVLAAWCAQLLLLATGNPAARSPVDMGVSENRGTPKWMVYNGKPY